MGLILKMADWKKYMSSAVAYTYKLQNVVLWIPQVKMLIVWLTALSGSFIHDFFPVSGSYFSSKKNVFNVFFVKKGWGWTCGLLLLFIPVRLAHQGSSVTSTLRHLLRLLYGTLAWFVLTTSFEFIENWTGHCEGSVIIESKVDCLEENFKWNGFDISGHCFLLAFCILLINDELYTFTKTDARKMVEASIEVWYFPQRTSTQVIHGAVLTSLSLVLTFLMILWEFMLFFTCLYFHTTFQKVSGTVIGICAWYVVHKFAVKSKKF